MRTLILLLALVTLANSNCLFGGAAEVSMRHILATKSNLFCSQCESFVESIQKNLSADADTLKKFVDDLCTELFSVLNLVSQCQCFMDEKLQPLIDSLKNGTTPKEVCQSVNLCN